MVVDLVVGVSIRFAALPGGRIRRRVSPLDRVDELLPLIEISSLRRPSRDLEPLPPNVDCFSAAPPPSFLLLAHCSTSMSFESYMCHFGANGVRMASTSLLFLRVMARAEKSSFRPPPSSASVFGEAPRFLSAHECSTSSWSPRCAVSAAPCRGTDPSSRPRIPCGAAHRGDTSLLHVDGSVPSSVRKAESTARTRFSRE